MKLLWKNAQYQSAREYSTSRTEKSRYRRRYQRYGSAYQQNYHANYGNGTYGSSRSYTRTSGGYGGYGSSGGYSGSGSSGRSYKSTDYSDRAWYRASSYNGGGFGGFEAANKNATETDETTFWEALKKIFKIIGYVAAAFLFGVGFIFIQLISLLL